MSGLKIIQYLSTQLKSKSSVYSPTINDVIPDHISNLIFLHSVFLSHSTASTLTFVLFLRHILLPKTLQLWFRWHRIIFPHIFLMTYSSNIWSDVISSEVAFLIPDFHIHHHHSVLPGLLFFPIAFIISDISIYLCICGFHLTTTRMKAP